MKDIYERKKEITKKQRRVQAVVVERNDIVGADQSTGKSHTYRQCIYW